MKLLFKSASLFCLILFLVVLLYSQDRFSISERYDIESGLSQSQVNCIIQDRSSLLWIGTQIGLNCFNGYDFITFLNDPEDKTTLSNNNIRDILIDETDDLWIATHGGCLNKFIKEERIFKRYHFESDTSRKHQHSVITKLLRLDSNTILLGTEKSGVLKFNKNRETYTKVVNFPEELLRNHVIDLELVNDSLILIGTEKGLIVFNKQSEEIINILLEIHHITSILALDSLVLIGDYRGKIYSAVKKDLIDETVPLTQVINYGVPVNTLYADGDNIFVGADTTIAVFSKKAMGSTPQFANSCTTEPLASLRAKIFFEDRSEILWVGTIDKGLYKVPKTHCRFNNIELGHILKSSLSVWSVIKDSHGKVWIGSDGDGLIRLDRSTGEFKQWINKPGDNHSISSNYISSIIEASDGKIWVSTYTGGVNIFDGSSFDCLSTESRLNPLSHNRVWQVVEDSKQNFWFATKDGLDYLNPDKNEILYYKSNGKSNGLSNNIILTICEDNDNLIWIGTYGGGLNVFDPKTGKFKSYLSRADDPTTISDNSVMSISEDSKGYLWIGTDIGLNRFDKHTESFTRYYVKNGLPDNVVYSVIVDSNDFIWMSTNKGISKFDPVENEFKNFDVSDGLQSNEFNEGAYFQASDGEIFFGGVNGITSFYPSQIGINPNLPNVIITKIKVFDEELVSSKFNNKVESIELDYHQNYLQIEFAGLEFTDPGKIKYKYMLEGFDDNWNFSDNRRLAIYTNLDPGNYVFKAAASNNHELWGTEESLISLTVFPPYWMTWWFKLLLVIAVLIFFWIIHKARVKRILEIENLRVKIASDLHDEVGASLASLSVQSQMLEFEKDNSKVKERINSIHNTSKSAISTMRDVVWSIDSRNDSLQSLVDRMKETSFQMFNDSAIEVNYKTKIESSNKKLDILTRQNIYLIFKEALANISNHSKAARVDIEISADEKFVMRISDNGVGLQYEKNHHNGNGLRNMKMRANQINANLKIVSNSGMHITLTINKF